MLMDCLPPTTLDLGVTVAASSIAQLQADGVTTRVTPAISGLWIPPVTQNGVDAVQFNLQPPSGDAITTAPQAIANAQWVITDGIMPGVTYQVSWRAVGSDGSVTDWSDPEAILVEQDFRTYSPSGPKLFRTVTVGGDDTLIFNDRGGYVRYTADDPATCIIPLYADVPFPLPDQPLGSPTCCVAIRMVGVGAVTVQGADGVTVNPPVVTLEQNGLVQLVHVSEDEWDVVGNISGAATGGGGGVSSINGATGAVTLTAGLGMTITESGGDVTIDGPDVGDVATDFVATFEAGLTA